MQALIGDATSAASTQVVKATTRTLRASAVTARSAARSTLNTATAPTYVDAFGIRAQLTWRRPIHGTGQSGPPRRDRARAIAPPSFAIRIILIDPTGSVRGVLDPAGCGELRPRRRPLSAEVGHVDGVLRASRTGSGFNGPIQFASVGRPDVRHQPRHGLVGRRSRCGPVPDRAPSSSTPTLPDAAE